VAAYATSRCCTFELHFTYLRQPLHARQTSTIVPGDLTSNKSTQQQPSRNDQNKQVQGTKPIQRDINRTTPAKLSALFCRRRCGKSGYTVPNLSPIHPTVLRSRCADPQAAWPTSVCIRRSTWTAQPAPPPHIAPASTAQPARPRQQQRRSPAQRPTGDRRRPAHRVPAFCSRQNTHYSFKHG
jgi:hypothetical protein